MKKIVVTEIENKLLQEVLNNFFASIRYSLDRKGENIGVIDFLSKSIRDASLQKIDKDQNVLQFRYFSSFIHEFRS